MAGVMVQMQVYLHPSQRVIIIHADSEDGFIPNALIVFKLGTQSARLSSRNEFS
jgi:hypothetical protein